MEREILLIFQRNIPKKRIFGRVCIDGGGVVGFKLEGGKPENFRNWSSFDLNLSSSRLLFSKNEGIPIMTSVQFVDDLLT